MAQQTINVGTAPNDGTGTPLRTAFQYTNSNFTELYTATGPSGNNINVPGAATITGNLTVDTNTLFVDSANNRVGVGTATPYATLHANSAIAAANFDWTTTFTAPTVGLVATSNNSSAWIRIATLDSNPTHDPYVNFLTSGGQNWSVGIDNSDSDKFKIALTNGFTGSNEIFAVDPSAVFSWYDGAGGTRMTLNSTGLGVGVSPSYNIHARGTTNGRIQVEGASGFGMVFIQASSGNSAQLQLNSSGGSGRRFNLYSDSTGFFGISDETAVATRLAIDASGNVISNVTGTAPTLATNSQMVFNLTSNTNLRISVRGSDGVTRTTNLTLA